MDIAATLREYEEKLLNYSVRKSADAVSSMLCDDFREFGSSGRVFSKPEMIASLQAESPRQVLMEDFRAELIAESVALVTYTTSKEEPAAGTVKALRSSLWLYRSGEWKMLFHQGTKIPEQAFSTRSDRNEPQR